MDGPRCLDVSVFFFFNDTATTEIYTLSLHDALPISVRAAGHARLGHCARAQPLAVARDHHGRAGARHEQDRKSTRLNSSHSQISYAVFCLKKKKKPGTQPTCRLTLDTTSKRTPCRAR